MRRIVTALALAALLTAHLVSPASAVGEKAGGVLIDGKGATIGEVQLEQQAAGVKVTVTTRGIDIVTPGTHGLHFHAVGKCDGPDFMSAGGHFNPAGKQHGAKNPQGAHAGDLPNLPIDASTATQGSGYVFTQTTTMISLTPGATSIFDADGTALVIHANPDDELTDPTGNSGGRVACAVLALTAPALPNTGAGGLSGQPALWLPAALLGTTILLLTVLITGLVRRRA